MILGDEPDYWEPFSHKNELINEPRPKIMHSKIEGEKNLEIKCI